MMVKFKALALQNYIFVIFLNELNSKKRKCLLLVLSKITMQKRNPLETQIKKYYFMNFSDKFKRTARGARFDCHQRRI